MKPKNMMNSMIRCIMTVLIVGASGLSARAEGGTTATYTAGARYVDLDFKNSRGLVQEYNGKYYYVGHGDVSVSNQGSRGLFDISVNDIGSIEENAALRLDTAGGLRILGSYDVISHRQPYFNNTTLVNGVVTVNPYMNFKAPRDDNSLFKRRESLLSAGYVSPTDSAKFLTLEYWMVNKKGDQSYRYSTSNVAEAFVDNTKQDITLSGGTSVGERSAVSLDLIRSEFKDEAALTYVGTTMVKPSLGRQQMGAAELKWRCEPSKKLALTGAFTARERVNLVNQYKTEAAVGTVNASYKATSKLSLTGRAYVRAVQVDENIGFRSFTSGTANTSEFDKNTLRGELQANYQALEKMRLKAGYKMQLDHRRDAPEEVFTGAATYTDGFHAAASTQRNAVAREDTKHTFNVMIEGELPGGIEADAGVKRLIANRAAFENTPTWKDEAEVGLMALLPGHVDVWARYGYTMERNAKSQLMFYSSKGHVYRAGVDWEMNSKASVGADMSYDVQRYHQVAYFGTNNTITSGTRTTDATGRLPRLPLLNHTENSTVGGHTRFTLPAGFVALFNGSYSVMKGVSSLNLTSDQLTAYNVAAAIGITPVGTNVGDLAPINIHVARGTAALEFTPEKFKNLTARASYSVDDWVDKYDTSNSGRASIAQVGASMKF